jgi:hypothetical protein
MPAASDVGTRLGKLFPRLASDHTGEVVATVLAIGRVLEANGIDWHRVADVVRTGLDSPPNFHHPEPAARSRPKPPASPSRAPRTPFQQAAGEILRVGLKRLTKRENEFLTDLLEWRGQPTEGQMKWLKALCRKYGVELENG